MSAHPNCGVHVFVPTIIHTASKFTVPGVLLAPIRAARSSDFFIVSGENMLVQWPYSVVTGSIAGGGCARTLSGTMLAIMI